MSQDGKQQLGVLPKHEKDKGRLLVRPRPTNAAELHDAGFVQRMFTPGDLVSLAEHVETADNFTQVLHMMPHPFDSCSPANKNVCFPLGCCWRQTSAHHGSNPNAPIASA